MNSIKSFIKQVNSNCVFLSPHLDDAVLSCGTLIKKLIQNKKQVTIITVFTKPSSPPWTQYATNFTNKCGFENPDKLFLIRKKEDNKVLKGMGCNRIHLNFIDACWRKKPNLNTPELLLSNIYPQIIHIYPSAKHIFSGKISDHDNQLARNILISIKKHIQANSTIFSPLGIGGHVDHVITHQIADRLQANTYYWTDFPYNLHNDHKRFFSHQYKIKLKLTNVLNKQIYIKQYSSQYHILFPEKIIPQTPETYFNH